MSSGSESSHRSTSRSVARTDGPQDSVERRQRPQPSSPGQYLRALPATALLDRLPVPMFATGDDGIVVYNNPAFSTMLGHARDVTLAGYSLSALLDEHSATPPRECVTILRNADNVIVNWHHAEGFPVRSVMSETLLLRTSDEILLFGVTDITELIWMYPPE